MSTRSSSPSLSAFLAAAALLPIVACPSTTPDSTPGIVVYTARQIVTLDANLPVVEAIAIEGDSILATGSLEEIEQSLAGRPRSIDRRFDDYVIVPGLINQHEHAWLAATVMLTEIISIEDWVLPGETVPRARDAEDYRRRLTASLEAHASDDVFYTWGYHQLFHGELSRSDLDAASTTTPIVVLQRSMHEVILNTRALQHFGIEAELIDRIPEAARSQTNLARGHFWEQGLLAVIPRIFGDLFRQDRYLPALERVERYWHAAGTTLVAEPGGIVAPAMIAMQNQVLGDPATPFRMFYIADGKSMLQGRSPDQVIEETEKLFESAQGMTSFLPKRVKLFVDGAMFSQLMRMRDGYLDGHEGEWLMEPATFRKAFRIYWDADYQIHVHQNGDAGLDLLLDVLEENMKRRPRSDHRTVIVHFGFSRPEQVDRIADLGAIVSANPFYTVALADRYSEVGIGPERSEEMVRLGDVVRAGVSTSLHADMPMAPGQPLFLMWCAINRTTLDGRVAGPDQRIDAQRALRAVTLDAAYSLGLEDVVGSIEPGKLANLTVLSENPIDAPPETIKDIRVWGTVHEGRVLPVNRGTPLNR